MSAGGVFKLIANDGKADKMIMATELLNQRIKNITCMRAKQGYADPTPTLVDIERTHILFVNAHFKPFAAIGYEYNKVRSNNGSANYGSSAQFSIPQFGDFFNDMVINVQLQPVSATVGTVPAFPSYIGSDSQSTTSTARVSGNGNTTTGVYTKYTHEYVDISGNVIAPGSPASNFVRYAEYPGQRLFKRVKFEVNGNPLDEYTSEAMIFHQKFKVSPNKMTGWKRLVGQEVPVEAYSNLLSIAGVPNYANRITNLIDNSGNTVPGSITNSYSTARKCTNIVCGPQTPKAKQPQLNLWVPLIFWFNKDPRLSIASVSIPYGQRFITLDIETQNNMLFVAPGNLFLRLTIEEQTSQDATKGTYNAKAVQVINRWTTHTPVLATGSVVDPGQQLENIDLYINNIFVNSEIHDIYIRRIGFSLIRVHRIQVTPSTVNGNDVLLSQMKWPIETIFVGVRPAFNMLASNPHHYRDWHRLTLLTDNTIDVSSKTGMDFSIDDTVGIEDVGSKHKYLYSQETIEKLTYPTFVDTVDTIEVTAHGINLFSSFNSQFFRDYIPYTFGGTNINTPEDPGALMINFCLYPGSYQPSGHINLSRAREFYIKWRSRYVTPQTPADFIALGIALNFILISDGSAVLRYST